MKNALILALCFAVPLTSFAASTTNGYKVSYDGGSVQGITSGSSMLIYIDQDDVRLVKSGQTLATIPATAITEISYGQDVHRRVGAAIGLAVVSFGVGALMALTKSKKHYVGLTWKGASKNGGFAMRCDKSNYRGVLAGLEGISGKKAVDSDAMTVKN